MPFTVAKVQLHRLMLFQSLTSNHFPKVHLGKNSTLSKVRLVTTALRSKIYCYRSWQNSTTGGKYDGHHPRITNPVWGSRSRNPAVTRWSSCRRIDVASVAPAWIAGRKARGSLYRWTVVLLARGISALVRCCDGPPHKNSASDQFLPFKRRCSDRHCA